MVMITDSGVIMFIYNLFIYNLQFAMRGFFSINCCTFPFTFELYLL